MSGLLRICTAGSVDDGKSTLIGRLLYDSRVGLRGSGALRREGVEEPRPPGRSTSRCSPTACAPSASRASRSTSRTAISRPRGASSSSPTRPGHEQYTRNMATGASTADVAILLVDARHGVRAQSRRHAQIARLLGINDFVLAVNKMDLVDFDRARLRRHRRRVRRDPAGRATLHPIPMSALHGDNVITRSERTPWFDGPSAARVPGDGRGRRATRSSKPFRFPVQLVLRPDSRFPRLRRADRVRASIRVGDAVTVVAVGPHDARQAHRHLGRRPRRGVRADVGHADARRRDRHQPRRHARGGPTSKSASRFERRCRVDGRAAARSWPRVSAEAHHADGDAPKSITG